MKMLEAVDVVLLDNHNAQAHGEALCCFRALWALGAPGLDFEIEASGLGVFLDMSNVYVCKRED